MDLTRIFRPDVRISTADKISLLRLFGRYCKERLWVSPLMPQHFLRSWPQPTYHPQVVALITEYWSENEEVPAEMISWCFLCEKSCFLHVWPHSFAGDGPHWRALRHQTSLNQVKHCKDKIETLCCREGVGEEPRCATCILQWAACLSWFQDTCCHTRVFG